MKTHNPCTKQAFTLPEIVITGLLLLMLMLPITRIAYLTLRGTQYARDAGNALAIGQAKLEGFSDTEYDLLADGTETVDGYTLTWTFEEEDLSKILRMDIQWSILGKAMQIDLNTIYTSPVVAGFSFE